MNQQTIDKIQPYIDEYCKANARKKAYVSNIAFRVPPINYNKLAEFQVAMDTCEKAIMQILIEENQLPTNPLI